MEIVLTDTHLKFSNIQSNIDIYKQAISIAVENNINRIFHIGDIFDERKGMPDELLYVFFTILNLFKDNNIKLIAIPGNHDKTNYESEISYLDAFINHSHFELIRDFKKIEISDKLDLHLIPFFKENTVYKNYLNKSKQELNINKNTFLLTHIGITGVVNNDGSKVENNLSYKDFKEYKKVLIGHYHNRSIIKDFIYYIGSAFQHNFGEDKNKGICIINDDLSISYRELDFKQYVSYIVNMEQLGSKEELLKFVDSLKQDKNYNRVILEGDNTQINSIDINKIKQLGISVKKKERDVITMLLTDLEHVSYNLDSITLEWQQFAELNNYDIEQGKKYINES